MRRVSDKTQAVGEGFRAISCRHRLDKLAFVVFRDHTEYSGPGYCRSPRKSSGVNHQQKDVSALPLPPGQASPESCRSAKDGPLTSRKQGRRTPRERRTSGWNGAWSTSNSLPEMMGYYKTRVNILCRK